MRGIQTWVVALGFSVANSAWADDHVEESEDSESRGWSRDLEVDPGATLPRLLRRDLVFVGVVEQPLLGEECVGGRRRRNDERGRLAEAEVVELLPLLEEVL